MDEQIYFLGEPVPIRVDHKRRANIPSRFLKILKEMDKDYDSLGLYYTVGDKYITCYSRSFVEPELIKHLNMPRDSKERRAFSSKYEFCRIDKQKRIVLPNGFGGLEVVVFVANLDTLEIWHPKHYQEIP